MIIFLVYKCSDVRPIHPQFFDAFQLLRAVSEIAKRSKNVSGSLIVTVVYELYGMEIVLYGFGLLSAVLIAIEFLENCNRFFIIHFREVGIVCNRLAV